MQRYIVQRVLASIPVLLILVVIIFGLLRVAVHNVDVDDLDRGSEFVNHSANAQAVRGKVRVV